MLWLAEEFQQDRTVLHMAVRNALGGKFLELAPEEVDALIDQVWQDDDVRRIVSNPKPLVEMTFEEMGRDELADAVRAALCQ